MWGTGEAKFASGDVKPAGGNNLARKLPIRGWSKGADVEFPE
jgi:hypothetical protein